jgi:hypothetical protein
MSNKSTPVVATMGIDIGKNSFHVFGLGGAIVLRQKWSRGRVEARPAPARSRQFLTRGRARWEGHPPAA